MSKDMARKGIAVFALSAAVGCGGSSSSSSFTTCAQTDSTCRGSECRLVAECLVDECESEISYEFEGEEYESMCVFGTTLTTTFYPLEAGPGTTEIRRDLEECFYKVDVEFNDVDQVRRCTIVRDCTLQELDCGPSAPGDPNCRVVGQSPCRA